MGTARNISAIAFILSSVFIGIAPVSAAGTDTGPASNYGTAAATNGKTTGGAEVQGIQQRLNDAEASMTAPPTTNGTAGQNSAAQVQAPVASNPGTLAESANTTALSTSTYH